MLATLPRNTDPNLLVGFDTHDDAAVYRLDDERALVFTADLITPPVDDPSHFGAIAAANALSDVFAMGGTPLLCLNLVGFPASKLPSSILKEIIAGAAEVIQEAGALLGGGHTTDDEEPKFGLAVVGLVDPARLWTNVGARPGDGLILTKPLGSGVLFNANRKGWISAEGLETCVRTLRTLNRVAAETLRGFTVHAVTDVTGFGLAGHALEMVADADIAFEIEIGLLPVLPEALEAYRRGMTTGVNDANRARVEPFSKVAETIPPWHRELLFDPQTSGGLLAAVAGAEVPAAVDALEKAGVSAVHIGNVRSRNGEKRLLVR